MVNIRKIEKYNLNESRIGIRMRRERKDEMKPNMYKNQ